MPGTLAEISWKKSAPSALVDAVNAGDDADLGRAVRKFGLPEVGRASSRSVASMWQPLWSQSGFESTPRSDAMVELLARLGKAGRKPGRKALLELADSVAEHLADYEESSPDPFELLGWLTILAYCQALPAELLGRLWRDAAGWSLPILDGSVAEEAIVLSADQRVLVDGELPYVCGRLFSGLRGARRCAARGAKVLRKELKRSCDIDGTPHARLLERLPLWLAPFVRTAGLARATGEDWLDKAGRTRFRNVVERCAALCRSNGETALSNGAVCAPVSLLKTACDVAGLETGHAAVRFLASIGDDDERLVRNGGSSRSNKRMPLGPGRRSASPPTKKKDRPASQSDESQMACLRNNWGVGEDSCVVAFDGTMPRIDLAAFGVPWASGDWVTETRINGQLVPVTNEWRCCCWCSDSDADYAELETQLSDDVTLLRQVLLSRADHFVLLVDIVQSKSPETTGLQHTMSIPLVDGIEPAQDAVTREWAITVGRLRLRVFPLGLEQESVDRADGSLVVTNDAIELAQQTSDNGLVCPLFLDFSPARRKKGVAWSGVTIAEDGRTLPASEASGRRLRIGDHQWLYLHNLTRSEMGRTALGLHTFYETVIGEITARGEIEPVMQVES